MAAYPFDKATDEPASPRGSNVKGSSTTKLAPSGAESRICRSWRQSRIERIGELPDYNFSGDELRTTQIWLSDVTPEVRAQIEEDRYPMGPRTTRGWTTRPPGRPCVVTCKTMTGEWAGTRGVPGGSNRPGGKTRYASSRARLALRLGHTNRPVAEGFESALAHPE
jgi:hypothetical protein